MLAAREHVADCPCCREYLAQDRELLAAYERLREERAPRRVRERVFDALARERAQSLALPGEEGIAVAPRGRPSRWTAIGVGAAALLLGGTAWNVVMSAGPPQDEDALFVEDYLRRAVGQDHIETSDPAEVARFLTRELGITVFPAQLQGLELAGAEVCLLDGQLGAMIRYEADGREIAYYVVPNNDAVTRSPELSPRFADGQVGGPVVITWSYDGVEQALVGELDPDRLLKIARTLGR